MNILALSATFTCGYWVAAAGGWLGYDNREDRFCEPGCHLGWYVSAIGSKYLAYQASMAYFCLICKQCLTKALAFRHYPKARWGVIMASPFSSFKRIYHVNA